MRVGPGLDSPRWLALVLALAFVWVYGYGIASYPLKWEEPRRCLVAQEMIESGDYVAPRLLGRPYYNKPPMQAWLIVAVTESLPVSPSLSVRSSAATRIRRPAVPTSCRTSRSACSCNRKSWRG